MAKQKLTPEQKAEVVAYYVTCQNFRATARHFGVSDKLIRDIVKSDADYTRKVADKNAEVKEDVIEHMAGQKDALNGLFDMILKGITREKIDEASARDLMTMMGIFVQRMLELNGAGTNAGKTVEDDPLTKALNEGLGDGIK